MASTSSQERSRSGRRSATSGARSRARANGRPTDAAARARAAAGDVTQEATGTLQQVAERAKGPALAGGAALAAVAGAVALARSGRSSHGLSLPTVRRKRRSKGIPHVSMPHLSAPHVSMPHLPHRSNGETTEALRATAKALGAAAVEVGKAGYRAGELASEVRRVREQAARRDD